MNSTELTYRRAALGGASGFGLLISLYDTLAGDLRRAADAERQHRIEERCRQVNHALLVIGHLEDWVQNSGGGDLSQQLIDFYASLRRNMIQAQVKRSAERLEQQMEKVLCMREMWQKLELGVQEKQTPPKTCEPQTYLASAFVAQDLTHACSWSA